jgi:hypothetical protein
VVLRLSVHDGFVCFVAVEQLYNMQAVQDKSVMLACHSIAVPAPMGHAPFSKLVSAPLQV